MSKKFFESGELLYRQLSLRLKIAMKQNEPVVEMPKEQIISDAKILCNEYIDDRLIRSGLNLKQRKITQSSKDSRDDTSLISNKSKSEQVASLEVFQILSEKRHASGGCGLTIDDMCKVLLYVGEVLELRHTSVYTDILQQLNVRSLAEVNLRRILMNVAKEIFVDGIDWARIVSLFAFAGGLAVDCVLSGSSVHIPRIKVWTTEFIETDLVEWIQENGGWVCDCRKSVK